MVSLSFKQRIIKSKTLFLFSLFVLIFFTFNLTKEIINKRELQRDINKFKIEINSLESGNQELSKLIEQYQNLEFVESEARTKLSLKKTGENILIVPESGTETENRLLTLADLENGPQRRQSNPQKWWEYFFNNELR